MVRISVLIFSLLTFIPSLAWAAQNSNCTLRSDLYKDRKLLTIGHRDQIRDTKAIDREYMDFFRALAESSLKEDQASFDRCAALATNDPIAARIAAFLRYLREGRKNPGEFISSFPTTEAQLADFWLLDALVMQSSVANEMVFVPGIPLPDGMDDKLLTELFALVLQDNPDAIKKYFFVFGNSNGEYAEFMDDQLRPLFQEHADLVLKNWSLIRPYSKSLMGMREENSPEFSQKTAQTFQALCQKRNDLSCKEVLRIFQ
jgi:hypothetical protein